MVGVRGGAPLGFAVGMNVGTCGAGRCWCLLRDCCIYCFVEEIRGGTGAAGPEQTSRGAWCNNLV